MEKNPKTNPLALDEETKAAIRESIFNDPNHKLEIFIKKSSDNIVFPERDRKCHSSLSIEEKALLNSSTSE